ncbi:MAG: hypothetical protein ABL917_01045 [Parcubacteria group bacterium]
MDELTSYTRLILRIIRRKWVRRADARSDDQAGGLVELDVVVVVAGADDLAVEGFEKPLGRARVVAAHLPHARPLLGALEVVVDLKNGTISIIAYYAFYVKHFLCQNPFYFLDNNIMA